MGKYHLIGIKGTGMSALAVSLKQLGHQITGSDVSEDFFTATVLNTNDIKAEPFNRNNITDDKIFIISAAYDYHNIEVREILNRKLEYYYYHDFMAKFYKGTKIGVSGTHGKTTTTLLLTTLFNDYKISAVVGDGTGIGNIEYEYFIFEACEYKNHFLKFNYDYLIINNIDFDHPDFFDDLLDVKASFEKAAKKANVLIINGDDENCNTISHPQKYSFGMNKSNFISCEVLETISSGYHILVNIDNKKYKYYLPFLGKHMIYNFLACLTVYYLNNGDFDLVQEKLIKFKKPKRRMEEHFYFDNIIVDDYAHHPVEIKACLETIKLKYPNKKVVVFFEPHTYTRTLALAEDFSRCFDGVDELYIAKTFTSKREKYDKILEKQVSNIFRNAKRYHLGVIHEIKKYQNYVIVFMGAGNIRQNISKIIY